LRSGNGRGIGKARVFLGGPIEKKRTAEKIKEGRYGGEGGKLF